METRILYFLPVLFSLPYVTQGITVEGVGGVGDACDMGKGVKGRCQEVRACLQEGGVVSREGEVHLCTPSPPQIIVCCRKPHLVTDQLCGAWAQYWRTPDGHCIEETRLIVGGVDADPGEFPHIAIVGLKENNQPFVWFCGGTLVSPHFVLTAAHCVQGDNVDYYVKLGEHDRMLDRSGELIRVIKGPIPSSVIHAEEISADTTSSLSPLEQTIRVAEVINHPEYEYFKYYDIALLKLSTKANFTERVLPACLPIDPTKDLVGEELTVAGWGWTSFSHQELTRVLQKVTVPVVDQLMCQYKNPDYDGLFIPKGILRDQLCAGKSGRDSCRGDSGGPLISQRERMSVTCEHTVEGLVSFGQGCGELGVYTRVSAFLDWITGYIAPGDY